MRAPTTVDEASHDAFASGTVVWVDAREALIVRWHEGQPSMARLSSDVPARHRATGHVRHDPMMGHASGGRSQTAGETGRVEHLERFLARVASRLAATDDLLILGAGTVHERLGRHVREADAEMQRSRAVNCEASPRLTEGQLTARLRHLVGADPRRRSAGAYPWTHVPPRRTGERVRQSIEEDG